MGTLSFIYLAARLKTLEKVGGEEEKIWVAFLIPEQKCTRLQTAKKKKLDSVWEKEVCAVCLYFFPHLEEPQKSVSGRAKT